MYRQIKISMPARHLVVSLLTVMSLVSSHAHADILDLPDPGNPDETYLPPTPHVEAPPVKKPEAPVEKPTAPVVADEKMGVLELKNITRKTGGQVYTVLLRKTISLKQLDLEVKVARLKLISANLTTDDGQKIQIPGWNSLTTLEVGTKLSASLNQSDRVKSFELEIESIGGKANILLSATGDRETPRLKLKVETPATPSNPSTPPIAPVPSEHIDSSSVIQPEDTVLYGNYISTVVSIDRRAGKASIILNEYNVNSNVRLSALSKRVRCLGQICTGDKVIYGNYASTVLYLFANHRIQVRLDLYNTTGFANVEQVTKSARCLDNICVGDSVLTGNYPGRVQAIYNNGKANVILDITGSGALLNIRDLAKEVKCLGQLCANDRVLMGNYPGRAKRIFSNNKVEVFLDITQSSSFFNARDLGEGVRCIGKFCKGDRAKLGTYTGTITEIFSNGQAQFRLDVTSSTSTVSVSNLTR